RAIALDPEYLSLAGKRLGAIYLKQKRWGEALGILRAVEELDPLGGDFQFHYGLGVALFNLESPQEALEYFEKVLAVDEKHIKSWEGRGLCHFRLGQYQKAREVFQELLEFNPTSELAVQMLDKMKSE
ncbi:tetratricopeptide repeat protein, partial [Candidatus Parcubacteria bacterium]|nr:tetratricopeptide repeat protein [Candidatus Parcubacteria bacterium]